MKTLRKEPIDYVECEQVPEVMEPNKLYYSEKCFVAIHLCLCGCGQKTVTPIYPDNIPEPGWQITRKDKLTITPSILQINGCKSHYIITNGVANFV
jgi:hypothetical protein